MKKERINNFSYIFFKIFLDSPFLLPKDIKKNLHKTREIIRLAFNDWRESYFVTDYLIKKNKVKFFIEIGVFEGRRCEYLLYKNPNLKVTAVDPWKVGSDSWYKDQLKLDDLYEKTINNLSGFGNRVSILKKTSLEALKEIEDFSVDMVFIDADHTSPAVDFDIENWYKKVKVGGILSGHDYGHVRWPDVKNAVDIFCKNRNIKLHCEDGYVWWLKKV